MYKRTNLPFFLLVFFILSFVKMTSAQCNPTQDSLALVALYDATTGDGWLNTARNEKKWKVVGTKIGNWFGVRTNTEGCVTGIDLDGIDDFIGNDETAIGNNLVGTLPNLNFSALTFLDLDVNKGLSGNLPAMILPEITLINLGGNSFIGNIPNSWNFPKLEYLALCCNQLDGSIPKELGNLNSLKGLYLQNNKLSGCIPREIKTNCPLMTASGGNISSNTNLTTQNWANYWNNAEGACTVQDTASCRYKDSLQLVSLYKATNGANWTNKWDLNKPISTWYGVALNIDGCVTCIDLDGNPNCNFYSNSGNGLVGVIPNFDLSNLQGLYLNNNQLSGSIPNFNLPNLKKLYLEDNQLNGNIPNFTLPNLEFLWLSDNQLKGNIPNFNLPNLQELVLINNQLNGSIPNFNLPNLEFLFLYDNQLSGAIPNFNLSKLYSLSLSGNQLIGTIPNFNLPNLLRLYLYDNQLSGSIPNFSLPNLQRLYLNNNQLRGSIPDFNLPNLQYLALHNNQLNGSIPNFNLPKLETFFFYDNRIDSTPRFTNLPSIRMDTTFERGLRSYQNKITFDDIIPNMGFATSATFIYAPQDSIYKDTTFTQNIGDNLTIDLGIDGAITDNSYKWFKNDVLYRTTATNKLPLSNLQLTDAGVYTCQVTNLRSPLLTLYSHKITVVLNAQYTVISARLLNQQDTGQYDNGQSNRQCFASSDGLITAIKTIIPSGTYQWRVRIYKPDSSFFDSWEYPVPALTTTGGTYLWVWSFGNRFNQIGNYKVDFMINRDSSGYEILATRNFGIQTPCSCNDSLQLVSLYNATNGANWTNKWNLTQPMNTWFGVKTNSNGCVTCIDLDGTPNCFNNTTAGNGLVGTIPNLNLSSLQTLILGYNQLSDTIPSFNLPNLTRLVLEYNQLTGRIPSFNLMPNLQYIFLGFNQLIGSIPNFILSDLKLLWLDNNRLANSIPNFNLQNLESIYLQNNQLNGCIPREIKTNCPLITATGGNISGNTNLATQNWANYWNNAEGVCMVQDTNSCRYKDSLALVRFFKATNGQIWSSAYRWDFLKPMTTWKGVELNTNGCVRCLDLDGDAIDCSSWSINPPGIGLSGIFPPAIGQLTSLYRLHLRGNRNLTGQIPDSIRYLTQLAALYIDSTGLSGALPDGFQYLTNLEDFTGYNTPFDAPIPNLFSRIKKMDSFNFSDTKTSGTIPISLANVDSLRRFYLARNKMIGIIPIELNQRLLHVFDISDNDFDSLPKLNLVEWMLSFIEKPAFYVQGNRLTFDDILPNLQILPVAFLKNYAPQDDIFKDTTITITTGCDLTVNLNIDGAITDNVYKWYQGTNLKYSNNTNKLILKAVQASDAGIYTCQVTNPRAPLLTLNSRKITLKINTLTPITQNRAICQGQNYKLPSGKIVSTASIYRDTLKSINGCDSAIIITNLAVNSIISTPLSKSICQGQTDTLPKGRVVSTAGTYRDTLKSIGGCDSVIITTLNINPPISVSVSKSICQRQMYILPKGRTVSDAGIYRDTLKNTNGCDSIIITTLNITPPATVKVIQRICSGVNYRLSNGSIATKGGVYKDTLRSSSGCDTILEITLITDTLKILKDDTLCTGQKYKLPSGKEVSTLGLYRDVVKRLGQCDTIYFITLTEGCLTRVRIFNGLTPDGAFNRNFVVEGINDYPLSKLYIYTRTNALIFQSGIPYDNLWNGTDQNETPLPADTYYYMLDLGVPNQKPLQGYILLAR